MFHAATALGYEPGVTRSRERGTEYFAEHTDKPFRGSLRETIFECNVVTIAEPESAKRLEEANQAASPLFDRQTDVFRLARRQDRDLLQSSGLLCPVSRRNPWTNDGNQQDKIAARCH